MNVFTLDENKHLRVSKDSRIFYGEKNFPKFILVAPSVITENEVDDYNLTLKVVATVDGEDSSHIFSIPLEMEMDDNGEYVSQVFEFDDEIICGVGQINAYVELTDTVGDEKGISNSCVIAIYDKLTNSSAKVTPVISGGGSGESTNVKINGSSITSNGIANIAADGIYDKTTNKLLTQSSLNNYVTKTELPDINGIVNVYNNREPVVSSATKLEYQIGDIILNTTDIEGDRYAVYICINTKVEDGMYKYKWQSMNPGIFKKDTPNNQNLQGGELWWDWDNNEVKIYSGYGMWITLAQTKDIPSLENYAKKTDIPDTSKMVTIDTNQTITGVKTFKNNVSISKETDDEDSLATLGVDNNGLPFVELEDGDTGAGLKIDTSTITKKFMSTEMGKITIPDKTGTMALTSDVSGKQDKLTAGSNITITNNVISANVPENVTIDNETITRNSDNELQSVGTIEQNQSLAIKQWIGTKAEYDAIEEKDETTLYMITDESYDAHSRIVDINNEIKSDIELTFDKVGYINLNGSINNNANSQRTDYINVEDYKSVECTSRLTGGLVIAWYDKDKNFISGVTGTSSGSEIKTYTDTKPVNAKYVMFSSYGTKTNKKAFIRFNENSIGNIGFKARFDDKKFLLFGDSITETAKITNDDDTQYSDYYKSNWFSGFIADSSGKLSKEFDGVKEILNVKTFRNYAKGNSTFRTSNADIESGTLTRYSSQKQIQMAIDNPINDDADVVVISMGTNDYGVEKDLDNKLGSYDSAMAKTIDNLDHNLLYDAIRWDMWQLRNKYPNAKFFITTPLQSAIPARQNLTHIIGAIKDMANHYNFIVINAQIESGIVDDFEVRSSEGRFLIDGIHPNTQGKQMLAHYYATKIASQFLK